MATVNLGRIKPVFRGAYSGSTAYVIDDIVTHGNESFICIQAHGAGTQATSVTAYWTKLAAKGADGTDVGTTLTTQGDILYRDGSGLQRLAKPGSNKFLQNTSGGVLSWADAGGGLVKTTTYENNSRNVPSATSNTGAYLTMSITKVKDAATSKVIVTGILPVHAMSGYFTGQYFDIQTANMTNHETNNSSAFQGLGMSYYSGQGPGLVMINKEFQDTTHFGTGSHTFEYGWRLLNGASDKPYSTLNPNSSDDGRSHQQGTRIIFQEVLI